MRVLICGDRNWTDEETIENYIRSLPPHSVVIQGMCRGADIIARRLAQKYGHTVMGFPANWVKYGRIAGPRRNRKMLDAGEPDMVVAFHDNLEDSKGTKNMIRQAKAAGVPTEVRSSNKTGEEK